MANGDVCLKIIRIAFNLTNKKRIDSILLEIMNTDHQWVAFIFKL